MRLILLATLALACSSCMHGQKRVRPEARFRPYSPKEANVWICDTKFSGVTYVFAIPDTVLKARSKWDPETSPPPCSPRQALSAAVNEAKRLRPGISTWVRENCELQEVRESCWVYIVRIFDADSVMGLPNFLEVPVLMSGEALHPVSQY